jgi:PBSX family phage terminase large subunit
VSKQTTARLAAPFVATERQNELADAWHDPAFRVVLADGAIRSGKTGGAARLMLETAVEEPSVYLVGRSTYRELEDSTKRAFLNGDGTTPPLIPPELIADYRVTDNLVQLHGGSTILFRSLDDPSKLLGLSLGGALIDQAEELDGGRDGEHVVDTLLGRLNAPGPRKLLLICNPAGQTHFVFRRYVNERTRDRGVARVHFTLLDNAAHLPDDYVAEMLATRESRPVFFKTYVEGTWGSFEGMAFTEFDERVHVVDRFRSVPDNWLRFESMDHGAASPTAWLPWATDEDQNHVVFDEHYQAGWLVSEHAREVRRRQVLGWRRRERGRWERHYCFADPSITASHGLSTKMGVPASVLTEYHEHGVDWLVAANNDRVAGYSRLLELLHVDERRPFPHWHPRYGEKGAPRMFIVRGCVHVIEQLRSAPVASDGLDAGKAVDGKWEHEHGHALAALRYGALSRPAPTQWPVQEPADWTAFKQRELLRKRDRPMSEVASVYGGPRYEW